MALSTMLALAVQAMDGRDSAHALDLPQMGAHLRMGDALAEEHAHGRSDRKIGEKMALALVHEHNAGSGGSSGTTWTLVKTVDNGGYVDNPWTSTLQSMSTQN